MGAFAAVYDACVLYPAPLRDFLMHLAITGVYQAKWTDRIHEEWIGALLQSRPDLTREQLDRTRRLMDSHVEDSLVSGYESLIEGLQLPDEKDRHVLAAAIHSGAQSIRDFQLEGLSDRGAGLVPELSRSIPTRSLSESSICFQSRFVRRRSRTVNRCAIRRKRSTNILPPSNAQGFCNRSRGSGNRPICYSSRYADSLQSLANLSAGGHI